MDIIIVGAGGHGRVVLDIVATAGEHRVVGFLDNNPALHGRRIDGEPVLGDLSQLPALRERGVSGTIIAIGDNAVRRGFMRTIESAGLKLVNAIHPSARVSPTARLGRNVVVAAGSIVCAHAQVGDSVILNTGCIIDHECMIGTSAHVCPGARLAGHVTVEAGAFIGIGATVVQNVRIGFEAVVGAGAVVLHDVAPMTTVVGVPAHEIKSAPSADEFAALLEPVAAVRHARADLRS
ncbi:MAG: acetyltransferase [Phycisphaerae bacterium]